MSLVLSAFGGNVSPQTVSWAPHGLIEDLKSNPTLAALFAKSSGVSEGYSVEEHTQMVLANAEKFKSTLEPKLPPQVDWDAFLLFLSLHDIGKGLALENQDKAWGNPVSFKEDELTKTVEIMVPILKERSVQERVIHLFTQLLKYDSIGGYLKGDIPIEEVVDQLLEIAQDSFFSLEEIFSIFDAFHMVDSSSYPKLFQSIYEVVDGKLVRTISHLEKMDHLKTKISLVPKGEKLFEKLQKQIAKKSPISLDEVDLHALHAYIHSTHILLLNCSEEDLVLKKEIFRTLKKGIRDLSSALEKAPDLLLDEIKQFKKNYRVRFSQKKLDYSETLLGAFKISEEVAKSLFKINWLHGTNSGVLEPLLASKSLIPTGRLLKMGITPFSGELQNGINHLTGVNLHGLSGVDLSDVEKAQSYSSNFIFNENQSKRILENFVNEKDRVIESERDVIKLNFQFEEVVIAIRRIRSISPEFIEQLSSKVRLAKQLASKAFEAYKTCPSYKQHMPKEKDPDGTLGYLHHDDYFDRKFEQFNAYLDQIDEAMNAPICRFQSLGDEFKNKFAMIFASMTKHTHYASLMSSERLVRGPMVLGKDIQMVFVPKEKMDATSQLFSKHGMGVKVQDISHLGKIGYIYKDNDKYLNK